MPIQNDELTELPPYPPYYPSFDLNRFLTIVSDNAALKRLIGDSASGEHIVELLSSLPINPLLKNSSAWFENIIHALAKIYANTNDIVDNSPYYEEYTKLYARLYVNPWFHDIDRAARALPAIQADRHLFASATLYCVCPFSTETTLIFQNIIESTESTSEYLDSVAYRGTFVPINQLTKAAFILNILAGNASQLDELTPNTLNLWVLASLRTLLEGISLDISEQVDWKPEVAFQRTANSLAQATWDGQFVYREDIILVARQLTRRLGQYQFLIDWLATCGYTGLSSDDLRSTDFPPTSVSLAREWLNESYPVWVITLAGTVVAANLPEYWLWGRLSSPHVPFQSGDLLLHNVYDILSFPSNFQRIIVSSLVNQKVFQKKLSVIRMLKLSGFSSPAYTNFVHALGTIPSSSAVYPFVQHMLDDASNIMADDEWEFTLHVKMPSGGYTDRSLEFRAIVSVIMDVGEPIGYVIRYRPAGESIRIFEEEWKGLQEHYGNISYTQQIGGDLSDTLRSQSIMEHEKNIDSVVNEKRIKLSDIFYDTEPVDLDNEGEVKRVLEILDNAEEQQLLAALRDPLLHPSARRDCERRLEFIRSERQKGTDGERAAESEPGVARER